MRYQGLGFIIFIYVLSCAPLQINKSMDSLSSQSTVELKEEPIGFKHAIHITQNPLNSNFTDLLSETIYENSSCYCKGNDFCTRGCSKRSIQSVKKRCTGRKSTDLPTKWCMRHVTGSIIHSLERFCTSNQSQTVRYEECSESLHERNKITSDKYQLCQRSFAYPSALCTLNLDGKNRINRSTIKNYNIRRRCLNYESLNHPLKFFTVRSLDTGEIKELPIFQEISIPKNPNDLPTGAIVVLQSSNINGHVEIKTNVKQCDGSDCFCSDFCVSRKNGWEAPFKPLVAFKWNPLFIDYLGPLKADEDVDYLF